MYHSTFLLNRQMITELSQIMTSLSHYKDRDGNPLKNIFYRLEWYKIGISIPMDLYSDNMPVFELRPECQLTHSEKLQELPSDLDEINFKIFIIPYKTADKNEDLDHDFICDWLSKQLKGAATIVNSEFGPSNRLYYKKKPDSKVLSQIQSYSLKGKLKTIDVKKLEKLRSKPLGYYKELGCGLLFLD